MRDERRACSHLLVEEPLGCLLLLTGKGMRYDLACPDCADDPELLTACEACVARALRPSSMLGWRGTPEVRHRDRAVGGEWATVGCAVVPLNDRCLAALPAGWLALTADGLVEISEDGDTRAHGEVVLAEEAPNGWEEKRTRALHTSPDGRFAAVVVDYGAVGAVVELDPGSIVSTLDRHDYHARTTPFPVAFTRTGDGTVIIAATEWNRLDAFDAATGSLVTARDTAEHYLDYFHGTLVTSPSGRWLFDDGWRWQPSGIRTVIDVAAWLAGDTNASEHGKTISWYSDDWDQPAVWVDDDTVAMQGLGFDTGAKIDGVQLVDVRSGGITAMFAGPVGPMWSHDGLLYVISATGLEIWSPAEEARIGRLDGFRPTAQHRDTGTLAELTDGQLRTWRPTRH